VGPQTPATGIIYVGELSTGRVIAYGFFFNDSAQVVPPMQMVPIADFQFREGAGA
jgi:hypothetical protein